MSDFFGSVALGSIVCKRCGNLIDTVDTEKVIIYYSDCLQEECIKEGFKEEAETL
jgi:hypothetical protein